MAYRNESLGGPAAHTDAPASTRPSLKSRIWAQTPIWLQDLRLKLQPLPTLNDLLQRLIPQQWGCYARARMYRFAGCRIGHGVEVFGRMELYGWPRKKGSFLMIDDGASIAPFCLFDVSNPIYIGKKVGIGPYVKIWTSTHYLGSAEQRSLPESYGRPVTIGDGAVLMTGATILAGVTVGRGAIIAAGAVVASDVAPNTFVGGVPAKLIRELPEGPIDRPSTAV